MTGSAYVLAGLALLVGLDGTAAAFDRERPGSTAPFAVANLRLEQNVTDDDFEIVLEAKGGATGLAQLSVASPDGRTIVKVTAPDTSTLGMRQFRFESPEPKSAASLKAAYPEGVYAFTGATAAGAKLQGESRLSHALPAPGAFLRPKPDAKGVPIRGLEIAWTPIKNLAAYIVYIEQAELGVEITARVPGSSTTFAVPDGFLRPGTEYQLGIGTVGLNGNISYVETSFTTAE